MGRTIPRVRVRDAFQSRDKVGGAWAHFNLSFDRNPCHPIREKWRNDAESLRDGHATISHQK